MSDGELEVAFRALAVREEQQDLNSVKTQLKLEPWPETVLLLDTETSIDAAQSFIFGSARVGNWKSDGTLQYRREYIIYADDLGLRDPDGFATLSEYVGGHKSERIKLMSRTDFLAKVFWPACQTHVLIVGFNLPFDLSRLALSWSAARRKPFRNGFSLKLWDKKSETGRENRRRPRIRIKHIDSKRSLIGLSRTVKNAAFSGPVPRR